MYFSSYPSELDVLKTCQMRVDSKNAEGIRDSQYGNQLINLPKTFPIVKKCLGVVSANGFNRQALAKQLCGQRCELLSFVQTDPGCWKEKIWNNI